MFDENEIRQLNEKQLAELTGDSTATIRNRIPGIREQIRATEELGWKFIETRAIGEKSLGTLSEEIINENDGMVSESDYDELVQKRAVGRLFGYWIDSDGKLLDCSSNRKIFAIPFEIAKDVPLKIAVSSGEDRIPVIQAALKTGLLDVLITDSRTAKKLLLSVDS